MPHLRRRHAVVLGSPRVNGFAPGSPSDISPTWLVSESSTRSQAEFKNRQRVNNGDGKGGGRSALGGGKGAADLGGDGQGKGGRGRVRGGDGGSRGR